MTPRMIYTWPEEYGFCIYYCISNAIKRMYLFHSVTMCIQRDRTDKDQIRVQWCTGNYISRDLTDSDLSLARMLLVAIEIPSIFTPPYLGLGGEEILSVMNGMWN